MCHLQSSKKGVFFCQRMKFLPSNLSSLTISGVISFKVAKIVVRMKSNLNIIDAVSGDGL